MTPRLHLLAVLLLAASAAGNRFMVQKISQDSKLFRHSVYQVNKLFMFVMPQTNCLQVETDETSFGLSFQEELHKARNVPPLVIGGQWSQEQGCKGFVIISSTFAAVPGLVKRLPRWSDHRVLVILKDIGFNTLQFALMQDIEMYMDAEVAIVSSADLTSGYLLPQPQRYYLEFHNISVPWRRLKDGPRNFGGRSITVMTTNCSMFSQIGPISEDGVPSWTGGFEMIVFQEIAERLNLKPRFKTINSLKAGWFTKPLNRTGKDRIDLAFCGILVSSKTQSIKEILMSHPMTILCLKLLVPRPQEVSMEWDGVFQPFSPTLWLVVALIVCVTTFLLQRFTFCTRRLVFTRRIQKYEKLGNSFLQILSILVLSDVPKSTNEQGAIRHLLTWWSLFTLIITTSFSSSLVSNLTNVEYTKKIDTIEELIKQGFHWSMKIQPEFSDLLNLNDVQQIRWKRRFQRAYSTEHHVMMIKKGKQALWGYQVHGGFALPDSDLPNYILKNFEVASHCFMEYFIGFALSAGSPLELAVNRYIRWYTEGGLVMATVKQVHAQRYQKQPYVYEVTHQTRPRPGRAAGLHLYHLTGIFLVWILGVALATVVFVLEVAQRCWI